EELKLLVVGHVAGGERRDQHADRQIADDRRQPKPPGDPARERGEEQQEAQLEDRQRRRLHGANRTGRPDRRGRPAPGRTPRHGLPRPRTDAYSPRDAAPIEGLSALLQRKEGQRQTPGGWSRVERPDARRTRRDGLEPGPRAPCPRVIA